MINAALIARQFLGVVKFAPLFEKKNYNNKKTQKAFSKNS